MIQYKEHIGLSLRSTLNSKLETINSIVRKESLKQNSIGLTNGLAGLALFQFYYAKFTDNDIYATWGEESLIRIIEKINDGNKNATYSSGLAGVGWVLNHLNDQEFIELDCDDLLSNIDDYLFIALKICTEKKDFDFLHGALGIAFYFTQRYLSTKQDSLRENYKLYIDFFVDQLTKNAIYEKNGVKWLSKVKSRDVEFDGYNLSISHGMSSIILLLTKLSKIDTFKATCLPLVKASTNYLLSNQIPKDQNSNSLFPSWILENGDTDKNSRLGWCYGDFSIGLVAMGVSEVLKDTILQQKALHILEHTTTRKEKSNTKVVDASLCHGAFGNAQIYNSINTKSKDMLYKDASTYWIDYGLHMSSHKDGFAGFKQWYGEPDGWQPKASLLEGVSGIGLSIIDYLSEQPNYWDKCLLIL